MFTGLKPSQKGVRIGWILTGVYLIIAVLGTIDAFNGNLGVIDFFEDVFGEWSEDFVGAWSLLLSPLFIILLPLTGYFVGKRFNKKL